MVQTSEYAIALLLLFFSAVALAVQIYDWRGFPKRPQLTGAIKAFGFLLVALLLAFWVALFVKIKGSKAWSNWLAKEDRPVVELHPAPIIMPTPQASIVPILTPVTTPTP